MPILRRFWDSQTATCSYLIGSCASRHAVFIDPVHEHLALYLGVLQELGYTLDCVLETHVHADHVSAAAALRRLTGAVVAYGKGSPVEGADLLLEDGQTITYADLVLHAIATPGHCPGAFSYRWGDRVFTGDSLLIGACGRTDEPGGNAGQLFDSIVRRLFVLPDEQLVFPGHGTQARWVSCIGEERRSNPLLQGISRDEFIALSSRRHAPPIADMEINLQANRRCGWLDSDLLPSP